MGCAIVGMHYTGMAATQVVLAINAIHGSDKWRQLMVFTCRALGE
ncbi:MHYT domain-containing protein [Aeromonas mytilicola]